MIERVRNKLKHSPALRLLFDGLSALGVHVRPYYVVLEGAPDLSIAQFENGFAEYEVRFLRPADMPEIAAAPERLVGVEELLERLRGGQLCLGVLHRGRIVAFSWCDMSEAAYFGTRLRLRDGEAYVWDTYTIPPYRGRGLAAFLRYRLYRELAKGGRHRVLSISEYFNSPSFGFKRKVKARPVELRVFFNLFNRWKHDAVIRRLSWPEPGAALQTPGGVA